MIMKVFIPISISTLLGALLSSSSIEAKDTIRRTTRQEEGSLEPEVADIIRGTPTGKALPYQVGLSPGNGNNNGFCGGSLISSRVVLTAAHCYINEDGSWHEPVVQDVRVNMYNRNDKVGRGTITLSSAEKGHDIIPHPNYNPGGECCSPYDIALVILPFGVEEGENIKYAKLNDDPTVPVDVDVTQADGERLYVSGWGVENPDGPLSDVLLGTVVNYLPDDVCAKWWLDAGEPERIKDGMMCAYSNEGTGHCFGDSGGPLVIASQTETAPATEPPLQVGIVSWSKHCGTEYPGGASFIYTRVSDYFDWITSTACEAVGQLCPPSKSEKSSKSSKTKRPSSVSVEAEEDVENDQIFD